MNHVCITSQYQREQNRLVNEAEEKRLAEPAASGNPPPYDEVGQIIAYEQGELDADATIALFAHLVKTGHAWSLQGSDGRPAIILVGAGYIALFRQPFGQGHAGSVLRYPAE